MILIFFNFFYSVHNKIDILLKKTQTEEKEQQGIQLTVVELAVLPKSKQTFSIILRCRTILDSRSVLNIFDFFFYSIHKTTKHDIKESH